MFRRSVLGIFAVLAVSAFAGTACNNTADLAALANNADSAFGSIATCTVTCVGKESCVSSCISKKFGVSSDCGSCFGADAQCTVNSCLFQCVTGAGSANCKACTNAKCTPAFTQCSGITPPSSTASNVMANFMEEAKKYFVQDDEQ
jgi:hypothetical protein